MTTARAGITRKSNLSEPAKDLVRLLQRVNFGVIEDLRIEGGEPIFDPPPRITREVKYGGQSGPRPEADLGNFALKRELVEFLHHIRQIGDGRIDHLTVRHGLPLLARVVEIGAA